ncbi:MAG: hypothetical protein KDB05_19970 [Planctomycetales bacterium]|nr:hypothetical protein [Planctomycetales bacterium]
MSKIVLALVIMVWCQGVVLGQQTPGDEKSVRDDRTATQFCGPCCVQYVLKAFGQSHDVDELIREIQWPESEHGATLDSLSKALSRRGVHVFPANVQNGRDVELISRFPIILHLNGKAEMDAHYVVWLPSESMEIATIWDPATRKTFELEWDAYSTTLSGAMLLTSPDPQSSPDFAIRPRTDPQAIWASVTFALTALGLLTICFARKV